MQINNKWRNVIVTLATVIGVYVILKYLLPLILPFILAYILVTAILPIVNLIYNKLKIPKTLSTGLILVGLVALVVFIIRILFVNIIKQIGILMETLPQYIDYLAEKIDGICLGIDGFFKFEDGYSRSVVDGNLMSYGEKIKSNLMPNLTGYSMQIVIYALFLVSISIIIFISAILIVKDMGKMKTKIRRSDYFDDIKRIYKKVTTIGFAYVISTGIIMLIVFGVCVIGLAITGNQYALLIGLCIAIIDALPIFGSGTVFMPWSIISIIKGDFFTATILISMYLINMLVRQFLEPKLIGEKVGIMPLYLIISMYVGLQIFGVIGFILGPLGLIITREILEENLV